MPAPLAMAVTSSALVMSVPPFKVLVDYNIQYLAIKCKFYQALRG
jgi:hypothetical protein